MDTDTKSFALVNFDIPPDALRHLTDGGYGKVDLASSGSGYVLDHDTDEVLSELAGNPLLSVGMVVREIMQLRDEAISKFAALLVPFNGVDPHTSVSLVPGIALRKSRTYDDAAPLLAAAYALRAGDSGAVRRAAIAKLYFWYIEDEPGNEDAAGNDLDWPYPDDVTDVARHPTDERVERFVDAVNRYLDTPMTEAELLAKAHEAYELGKGYHSNSEDAPKPPASIKDREALSRYMRRLLS